MQIVSVRYSINKHKRKMEKKLFNESEIAQLTERLPKLKIREIALLVCADWKNIFYGAKPYLQAMLCVNELNDRYIAEDGRTQVVYFLGNAQTWRGPIAKLVKAELNKRLKAK